MQEKDQLNENQPQLFENPPQPATPEASRQKHEHELLLRALLTNNPEERRRLATEWTDLKIARLSAS
jgi:hypothetical protein